MTDLELLEVLQSLVRLAKTGATASAAFVTVVGATYSEAKRSETRAELAKLSDPSNVVALRIKLQGLAAGIFAPPIVSEAAGMLAKPEKAAWLVEVGRLAKGS